MSKTLFLLLLFASPAFAQDQAAAARTAAGCGPGKVDFDVKTDKKSHLLVQPESGKSLVYIFEEEKTNPVAYKVGAVTLKVGLDGSWVGATHGDSYIFFSVEPGDHRLCASWQSAFERMSKLASAVSLTAEPGQIYYFHAYVDEHKEHQPAVYLEPLDPAQAQLLLASSGLSTSHPKK